MKKCLHCQQPITTQNPRAIYCSSRCGVGAARARKQEERRLEGGEEHTCERCSAKFRTTRSFQRYCSQECYLANKASRRALKHNRMAITKTCETCGKEYQPFYAEQRYCNGKCRGKSFQRKPRACIGCGKKYQPTTKYQQWCSNECRYSSAIGKRTVTSNGLYWRVMLPPGTIGADQSGRMLEHRWVMQQALSRPLADDETVHHINGDKLDNRLENLQLRKGKHGKGIAYVCADCGSHNVVASQLKERQASYG